MRPDQSSISAMSVIYDDVQVTLRHVLEEPYPGESSVRAWSFLLG
jgi:hypothetical protein